VSIQGYAKGGGLTALLVEYLESSMNNEEGGEKGIGSVLGIKVIASVFWWGFGNRSENKCRFGGLKVESMRRKSEFANHLQALIPHQRRHFSRKVREQRNCKEEKKGKEQASMKVWVPIRKLV